MTLQRHHLVRPQREEETMKEKIIREPIRLSICDGEIDNIKG